MHFETVQWQTGERTVECSSAEANEKNLKAVNIIRRHLNRDYVKPVPDPGIAVPILEEAIKADPLCYTARLNLAILLPLATKNPVEDFKRMETQLLADIPESSPLYAKAILWKAVAIELQGNREKDAHAVYWEAFNKNPELSLMYFGKRVDVFKELKKQVTLLKDSRMSRDDGVKLQTTAMKKILLYFEYAKHFAGYNYVTKEQAFGFHDVWFMLVKNVLPPYVLKALQECFRGLINSGALKFDDKQAKRYFHYNSPPIRFVSAVMREFVSNVWDTEMKSTYTYMGGYVLFSP
eukprot:TRINITY_DN14908_c0_g1_i1.p1 TRINITY_DN14908_c0_g1~~TRINITY_DN14908_c0_g1_i1.p1  ORF type:complete len:333 (+),score=49.56 TRINITY_DN14908_c0_g1_i1:122-1000(+)